MTFANASPRNAHRPQRLPKPLRSHPYNTHQHHQTMQPTEIHTHPTDSIILPNTIDFPSDRVYIKHLSNALILIPADNPWQLLFDSLDQFSDDCFENFDADRHNFVPDKREELFP